MSYRRIKISNFFIKECLRHQTEVPKMASLASPQISDPSPKAGLMDLIDHWCKKMFCLSVSSRFKSQLAVPLWAMSCNCLCLRTLCQSYIFIFRVWILVTATLVFRLVSSSSFIRFRFSNWLIDFATRFGIQTIKSKVEYNCELLIIVNE
jgi:hypothetical protein